MTNKPEIIRRMEVTEKHTAPTRNPRLYGLAETIVFLLVVAAGIGLVLVLNAVLPGGW